MRVPEREDPVTAGKIEIGFARVIPNRRAACANGDGGARKLHHPRERRIHKGPVVFVGLVVERLRRLRIRFDHAATAASARSRSILASTIESVSAAVSVRINRSRSSLAPKNPLR